MRTDILERKEDILKWIEENQSKAFICRELKCKPETLNSYLKQMGIEYAGNKSGKGMTKENSRYMPLEVYLKESVGIQSDRIRRKLLRENIKPYQCECCKNTEWLGQPIPLELHHIDGNKTHNEISNFMLLCPNCHAFTDSYRGRNSRAGVAE